MDERRDHDTVPLTYQPSLTSNAALSPSISAVHFSRTPTPPLRYHRTVEGSTSSATSPYRQSIPNSELPSEYSHSPIFSSGSTSERLREAGKMVWLRFFISFRRKWNKAVISRSRGPRIVYTMVGLGFVGMWISVVFIFVKERPPLKPFGSGDRPFSHENIIQNPNSVYWNLEGTLQQFDHVRRTLSINWVLNYVISGRSIPLSAYPNTTAEIGIFQDQLLVPVNRRNEVVYTNSSRDIDHFRLANTSAVPVAVVGLTPLDSFSTEIDMNERTPDNTMTQPQFGFPFDYWIGSVTFVGNDYRAAASINRTEWNAIQIDGAILVGSLMNWRITAEVENTCTRYVNEERGWIYANDACGLHIILTAKRSPVVKLVGIFAVIVNWLSTIFIFIMTCEGVIMRRFQVIMGSQLLGVSFTALFALPTIRSTLPGVPEFGALIDLLGIIPNVIIISLCTTLVVITTLRQIVEEKRDAEAYAEAEVVADAATAAKRTRNPNNL